ncbi:MAG: CRTAC1 family protein [Phycisphaeraceae bacterium]
MRIQSSIRQRWKHSRAYLYQALLMTIVLPSICMMSGTAAAEDIAFTDVTKEAGLTHVQRRQQDRMEVYFLTGGAAVGDFFGNGRADLFVTRQDDTDIMYKNMGDGTFVDVSEEVFGPDRINAHTNGALLADLNNNGHLDLVVSVSGGHRHLLFINDGNGKLIEQGEERGTAHAFPEDEWLTHFGMGVTAGDYNNDGYLDVFINEWDRRRETPNYRLNRPMNRLYRNRGAEAPAYFDDVTKQAGLDTPKNEHGFTARFADLDMNGLMDLLVINDYGKSQYLRNQGDGTFVDVTNKMGTGTGHNEMGSTVADYNNDGWLDWFTTSIYGGAGNGNGNRLYRNEMRWGIEGIYFSDQTDLGVREGAWGWAPAFIDANNNGVRDLVMVNGFRDSPFEERQMRFWRNRGESDGYKFEEISSEAGLTDRGQGRGLLVADFDNDGYQDILVINNAAEPVLYRNNGGTNKWLRIKTVGEVSNRMGIGAFITVIPRRSESFSMVHDVNLGGNFLAHNETTAHFGLGDLEGTVDHIHIRWPSGLEQELTNVQPNQVLTIYERDAMADE